MNKRLVIASVVGLVLLAVGGFALGKYTVGTAPILAVQNTQGEEVVLDLRKGPVVFIAYWCPHCERFLTTAKEMGLERLPTVVSIWPREGDTFEDMVRKTKEKLEQTGWGGTPFYVLMSGAPSYVPGTPTLAWWDAEKEKIEANNPLLLTADQIRALMSGAAKTP